MSRFEVVISVVLGFCLPIVISTSSGAADSQWARASRAGARMYAEKDFRRAAELYGEALKSAEEEHLQSEQIANTLLNLSQCQIENGTYADAWATIVRAQALIEKLDLVKDPIAVRLMRRQTYFYKKQRMIRKALICQKYVVEQTRTIFGESNTLISELILLQSLQLDIAQQPKDSLQTGLSALALMKHDHLDPHSFWWLLAYNRTGSSMLATGDVKGARDQWLNSLRLAVECRSAEHAGWALEQLAQIAAHEPNPRDQAALVSQLLPLSEQLAATEGGADDVRARTGRKQLLELQRQLSRHAQIGSVHANHLPVRN